MEDCSKKDTTETKVESAVSKKRKIYGIDSDDYTSQEEFYSVVNSKICEVCDKKIDNIQRHIKACEEKYKKLCKLDERFFYSMIYGMINDSKMNIYYSDEFKDFRKFIYQSYIKEYNQFLKIIENIIGINQKVERKVEQLLYSLMEGRIMPGNYRTSSHDLEDNWGSHMVMSIGVAHDGLSEQLKRLFRNYPLNFLLNFPDGNSRYEIERNVRSFSELINLDTDFLEQHYLSNSDGSERYLKDVEYSDLDVIKDFCIGISCLLNEKNYDNEELKIIINKFLMESDSFKKLIQDYIDYVYYCDLNSEDGIFSIIDYVRKNVLPLPDMHFDGDGVYTNKPSDVLYIQVTNQIRLSDRFYHPIFNCKDDNVIFGDYKKEEKTAINLLLQISALKEQLEYYLAIRKKPENAIFEFMARDDSWSSIMQHPYWIRLGRDSYRNGSHERFNLFMIKPGTEKFDESTVRYFVQKKDKNFEDKLGLKCGRMLVTIPDSLEYDSLVKVIDFAHQNALELNFVCQSPSSASVVKNIIVERELKARKESGISLELTVSSYKNYYMNDYCFVNVDPDYYNQFFVDTPNNKNFWHRYDYTSDYKYRREFIPDLKDIVDMCIKERSKDKSSSVNTLHETDSNDEIIYSADIEKTLLDNLVIDGRNLSLEDDIVLAFICCFKNDWKKWLPFIGNYEDELNIYMSTDEGKEQVENMKISISIFKKLFSNNWNSVLYDFDKYDRVVYYYMNDLGYLEEAIKFFKLLFPQSWWKRIRDIDKYSHIIFDYKNDSSFVNDILILFKMLFPKTWRYDLQRVFLYNEICSLCREDNRSMDDKKHDLVKKYQKGEYCLPF